jgi:hypothetical protein
MLGGWISNAMEDLLNLIAGVDEEEDLFVKITETSWLGPSLRLTVEISVVDGPKLGTWLVRCGSTLKCILSNEGGASLDLLQNHPLLWDFTHPSASAFFSGVPANSAACVGALYETHLRAVGNWISFGPQFNKNLPLSHLLSTGNGLLARGPVSLLSFYKEALLTHGVEVNIVSEYGPKFWDGTKWKSLVGEDIKILLLGSSYVIGIGWAGEQVPLI